jgi:hypothetical protein
LVIGCLILLGLIASVFLIFSSSVQLVRVGLVTALWAAVIGALAASRYRRAAEADQAKVHDLRMLHELQLEREIATRREFEFGVEARVRQEVGAEAGELAALRAELTVLRESLQRLFDGGLVAERPALHADAVRLQELPGAMAPHIDAANDNRRETETWDAWSSPMTRYPVTPVFEPDHPEPPAFASPYDEPVTAETSVVTAEDLEAAESETEVLRNDPSYAAAAAYAEAARYGESEPSRRPETEPPVQDPPTRPVQPESSSPGTSSRRRRSAESGDDYPGRKLSVAEIMANLQSERGAR